MRNSKNNKALMGTGILLAFTSSLCCILPLLSILGAITGLSSSLSWVEGFRPYLIMGTVLILAIAFFRAYKPKKSDDCGCSVDEKQSFVAFKRFLWIITVVSVLLISFPYYSGTFLSNPEKNAALVNENDLQESILHIEGMTCKACEGHVNNALQKQLGVVESTCDYEKGLARVKYDKTKVTADKLAEETEKKTGYKVTR